MTERTLRRLAPGRYASACGRWECRRGVSSGLRPRRCWVLTGRDAGQSFRRDYRTLSEAEAFVRPAAPAPARPAGPEAALLRAVCEAPADDLPRLALADLWEERGGPGDAERSEFVRVQVELAALRARYGREGLPCISDCPGDDTREIDLRWRERELFSLYPAWMPAALRAVPRAGLALQLDDAPTPPGYLGGVWRRGFIASVALGTADLVRHARELFAAAPLEEVRLTDRAPEREADGRRASWRAGWHMGGSLTPTAPGYVPATLWRLLPGGGLAGRWRVYESEAGALAALSRACVAFGRAAAAAQPAGGGA